MHLNNNKESFYVGQRILYPSSSSSSATSGHVPNKFEAGTIKYLGKLENDDIIQQDCEWAGIEWDNPLHGKNDGEVFGKRYFDCNKLYFSDENYISRFKSKFRYDWLSSASFIKMKTLKTATVIENAATLEKASIFGCSFMEGIVQRYKTSILSDAPVIIGSNLTKGRTVEIIGADLAEQHFQNFSQIESIDLSDYHVSSIGDLHDKTNELNCAYDDATNNNNNISKVSSIPLFPRVRYLSLANHLLTHVTDFTKILDEIPLATTVILSHSRFSRDIKQSRQTYVNNDGNNKNNIPPWKNFEKENAYLEKQYPSVSCLILRDTGIELADFSLLTWLFPNLHTLDVSLNPQLFDAISNTFYLRAQSTTWLPQLKTLICQENKLHSWKQILLIFQMFPSITSLNLNYNDLSDYDNCAILQINKITNGATLTEFSLEHNDIQEWSTLRHLIETFVNLQHFRWIENPLQIYADISNIHNHTVTEATTATIKTSSTLSGRQLSRQLVVSLFSKLVTLNGGPVTSIERKHAELYFLSLCARKFPVCLFVDPTNIHRDRLEITHKTGWFQHNMTSAQATSNDLSKQTPFPPVSITLIPACSSAYGKPEVTRQLVPWLKVGDLKLFCQRIFSVPSTKQKLSLLLPLREGVIELADDSCSLNFYGLEAGCKIMVGDISEP